MILIVVCSVEYYIWGLVLTKKKKSRKFEMTAIEALRLQLDNLQKEKQELEVKLLQIQPDAEAIVEIEQERDLWKEKYEGVVVENSQLRVMYEELLKYNSQEVSSADSVREQQIIELQEQLKQEEVNVKQWKSKCEEFSFISTA